MMNLRCLYCQTPFTLPRTELLTALISMNEKSQNHYDAHCPRCRRANSISRQRMELYYPNWREAAKNPPPVPAPAESKSASASVKTEPLSNAVKSTASKAAATKKTAAAAAKPPASKRQRASKPASAKKTTPSKASPPKSTKTSSKDKKK